MIKIEKFVFNSFQENTFVLYNEANECIIVDAGCYTPDEEQHLTSYIENNNLNPVRLINTHGHVDHVLGVEFLSKKYDLPLELHTDDKHLAETAQSYGTVFGFDATPISTIETALEDGMEINFGESSLTLFHVPGHSPGSIALFAPAEKFVVVGDVLFNGSIGRTDLPGGDYDTLMESILTKLLPLGDDVTVYSGHGPESSIGYEKISNPFIIEHIKNQG